MSSNVVSLHPQQALILTKQQLAQRLDRSTRWILDALAQVPKTLGDERVFHTPKGAVLNKSNLGYIWRRVANAWEATGHRHIDAYELRHACATLLLARGLSVSDCAAQLGHVDGGVLVAKLYGHPDAVLARDRAKMALADMPVRLDERERRAG